MKILRRVLLALGAVFLGGALAEAVLAALNQLTSKDTTFQWVPNLASVLAIALANVPLAVGVFWWRRRREGAAAVRSAWLVV